DRRSGVTAGTIADGHTETVSIFRVAVAVRVRVIREPCHVAREPLEGDVVPNVLGRIGHGGVYDAEVCNLPITSISVQRWLDRLSPRFRQIAMTRLSEVIAVSLRAKNGSGSQGR